MDMSSVRGIRSYMRVEVKLNLNSLYCVWIAALLGLILETWGGQTLFVMYELAAKLRGRVKAADYC